MGIFLTIIGGVVLLYAVLSLLLYLMQDSQVYVPARTVAFNPSDVGLEFEDLYLPTPDGETINAWYIPAKSENTGKTVLFCHGNGGDMGNRVDVIKTLHDMGLAVMIFDYRGYGKSTGKSDEQGTYIDARTALDYLVEKKGLNVSELVLHGRSLGGAVAVWLASKVEPAVLTIESSFSSAKDMAARRFPFLPSRLLCRYTYDSHSLIGGLRCPVLIAHGRADDVIPFDQAEKLFEAANEPKQFLELHGNHNATGLEADEAYRNVYEEIVADAL